MNQPKKEGSKIPNAFTAITENLWEADFDIYEVNIIARIASWQRQNKPFFESEVSLAERFRCTRPTVKARLKRLLSKDIIKIVGKNRRANIYEVNIPVLNRYIQITKARLEREKQEKKEAKKEKDPIVQPLYNDCIATIQNDESIVQPLYNECIATIHYQTNQSIDQNTQMDEQDAFCSVLPSEPEETIDFQAEFDLFLQDLD